MWAARGLLELPEGAVPGTAKNTSCESYIDRLAENHIESVRHTKACYAGLKAERAAQAVATRKARAASRKEALKVLPQLPECEEV